MSVAFGVPVWTDGRFKSVRAENDLGLESVGASLLRRLLPGILQTTPHAGYYAFYAYLLTKWEESNESILREEFVPFFRRQEVAYACGFAACDHVLAHDLADRARQSAREVAQQHHGRVALACLEIGKVTLRHAGGFGQPFAGHAPAVPQRAHPLAERGQEGVARVFETSSLVHVVQYLA